MMLHMTVTGAGAFCGDPSGPRISLISLVRFHPLTFCLMRVIGCHNCAAELRNALRSARPIR